MGGKEVSIPGKDAPTLTLRMIATSSPSARRTTANPSTL
jgi:hypothetical protein